jgi:membrane protein DedA with SNARE-associated domain
MENQMELASQPIFQFFHGYAYEPLLVYLAVVGMMLASGFGLPLPEEVTLLSVGVLAFMGSRPDLFPPPSPNAAAVNMHHAALVAFAAVILSDSLIYGLGRMWGRKILYHDRMRRIVSIESLQKVEEKTKRFGMVAVFAFRFTPGIRFPGHLACGAMKLEFWRFLMVDGFAAMISVPTQIYLVAIYGEPIIKFLQEVKLVIIALIFIGLLIFFFKKLALRRRQAS